jgi:hypothetical protein
VKRSIVTFVLASTLAVAAAGQVCRASVTLGVADWHAQGGMVYHEPHYMPPPRPPWMRSAKQCCGLLGYHQGPVLERPHAYLIFWGYGSAGDPDGVEPLLKTFIANIGASAWVNTVTQYYGLGMRYPKNVRHMLGGVWDDNANPIPSSPTDADVAAEALRAVAMFGFDRNGAYIVATAHGHNTSGFGTTFCGYHSDVRANQGLISYTNLPYMPDAPICGSNKIQPSKDESAIDEGVTIVSGHEFAESITDPKPVSGWYNSTYGELGDECAWTDLQNTPFGPYSFATQPLFSNASDSCVQSYP